MMDCQQLFGARATDCVSPSTLRAWCDCGGTPCDEPVAARTCESFGDEVRDTHPRLLVRPEDLATWSDLASEWPWSDFQYDFNHLNPTWDRPITTKAMGAMIGYVLHREGPAEERQAFRAAILDAIDGLYENGRPRLSTDHSVFVGTAGTTMACLMALDVIYSDPELADADRDAAHAKLQEIVQWYRDSSHRGWRLARLGLLAAWSIFEGNEEQIAVDVENYTHELKQVQSYPDGSFTYSPGYFSARIGERLAKTAPIDVISRSGVYNFYCDDQMADLMGWASSFWLTPFGAPQLFGDTINNGPEISPWSPGWVTLARPMGASGSGSW